MRSLLSLTRPIPGIPFGATWQDPSTDPASNPGPWAVDTLSNVLPDLETTLEEQGHTAAAAGYEALRIPLYDTVFRLNLRDGLWYEFGVSGNMPLTWDEVNQVWIPRYDPDDWEEFGVRSGTGEDPPPEPRSVRLNGAAGTYIWTGDAATLNFTTDGFTLIGIVALDDWTPAARSPLVSQWGSAGNQGWVWSVDPDGFVLEVSRDGTAVIEHKLVTDLSSLASAAIAVSFVTDVLLLEDQVRFWLWDGVMWNVLGTVALPNLDLLPLFNTTADVEIGRGTAGLYHLMSIREGVGLDNALAGNEIALMRGDLLPNPSYDRYGNLWTRVGGWTQEDMLLPPGEPMVRP
jgi:hypothetical protein